MEDRNKKDILAEIDDLKEKVRDSRSGSSSDSEYGIVLEHLPVGVVIHGGDTEILYSNPAAQDILGLSKAEMLGKKADHPLWHFTGIDGEKIPVTKYPVNVVKRSEQPLRNQVMGVFRPKWNDRVWVNVSGVAVHNNDTQEIDRIIITFNVAHYRTPENNEERLRTIVDNTPLGICITDENGYFEYVNPAYSRLYKYKGPDLIGKHFTIVVPEEQKQALSDLHDRFIQTSLELRGEWDVIDKSGDKITILADAARITGADGRPRKVTFVMDITEKKKLELLREDVERIMRHDLKAPLTGIIGFPELLLESGNLTEEQKDHLKMIESSGKKMRDMINMSLDMYKMETGTYNLAAAPVDLILVLEECVRDLNLATRAKQVDLVFDCKNNERELERYLILGDSLLCYSMFSNLALNAIEASPPREKVTITIESTNKIEITIHNSGAVPSDLRASFFDKYSTHNKHAGTGLGTYSAKLYANAMGGDISMETSDEKGTYLTVTFPILSGF